MGDCFRLGENLGLCMLISCDQDVFIVSLC